MLYIHRPNTLTAHLLLESWQLACAPVLPLRLLIWSSRASRTQPGDTWPIQPRLPGLPTIKPACLMNLATDFSVHNCQPSQCDMRLPSWLRYPSIQRVSSVLYIWPEFTHSVITFLLIFTEYLPSAECTPAIRNTMVYKTDMIPALI